MGPTINYFLFIANHLLRIDKEQAGTIEVMGLIVNKVTIKGSLPELILDFFVRAKMIPITWHYYTYLLELDLWWLLFLLSDNCSLYMIAATSVLIIQLSLRWCLPMWQLPDNHCHQRKGQPKVIFLTLFKRLLYGFITGFSLSGILFHLVILWIWWFWQFCLIFFKSCIFSPILRSCQFCREWPAFKW